MLVHLVPAAAAAVPMTFGILTLFGKKKKEAKTEDSKPLPDPPVAPVSETQQTQDTISTLRSTPTDDEVTSFAKLLESFQDLPNPQPTVKEAVQKPHDMAPSWIQPRATPPSRPMVIVPGEKGKVLVEAEETSLPRRTGQKSEVQSSMTSRQQEGYSVFPRFSGLEEEIIGLEEEVKRNLESPERIVKRGKPEAAPIETKQTPEQRKKLGRGQSLGFDHIFELTQSALESRGFVIVGGPAGSGKSTLCSTLTAAYLRRGTPCMLVTYDQSPGAVRERLGSFGCDVSTYESQFRFLLVDAHSAQSETFSMEPYYLEKPFDLSSLRELLVKNVQIFMADRVAILIDSLDGLLKELPAKDFQRQLQEMVNGITGFGSTLLAAVDVNKLPKELLGPLDELASCWIELEKDDHDRGKFRVRKPRHSAANPDPVGFSFDPAKGLVFT